MHGRVAILVGAMVFVASCGSSGNHSAATATTASTVTPTTASSTATTTVGNPAIRVVQAYIDAFNGGDAHGAASEFATDARFSTPLGSCSPCLGRSVIQQKLAAAIAAGTKVAVAQVKVTGDTVRARSTLTSPRFPPGVKRAIGTFTAVVSNGNITQLIQMYDRSDPQTAALFKALGQ